jgi:hypothetical protein
MPGIIGQPQVALITFTYHVPIAAVLITGFVRSYQLYKYHGAIIV